jgi:NIMA (never in mitosis gene a)-related kinase
LENKETNELFAVKRVFSILTQISCFGMSEYELAGALNEVRILASLEHPNIVKFYDGLFDKDQDHLYIFLEYANGGDVSQLIEQAKDKRKRVSENTVWKILLNVA